jgi:hypothetical protein
VFYFRITGAGDQFHARVRSDSLLSFGHPGEDGRTISRL